MKPIQWLGSSRADVRAFPAAARRVAGFQLHLVQRGSDPNDWKPFRSVGPGVREIRVHTGLEHRIVYVATFAEAVYVLHAFGEEDSQDRAARRQDCACPVSGSVGREERCRWHVGPD